MFFWFFALTGKYLSLCMLCFTSILVPSISTGLLFVVFLCCITYWACYKDLGKGFAILCRLLCAVIFVYMLAIFCYQTQIVQESLNPEGWIPRYRNRSWMLRTFVFRSCQVKQVRDLCCMPAVNSQPLVPILCSFSLVQKVHEMKPEEHIV